MEQFYYGDKGEQKGPITREQLHELLLSNAISPETPIWNAALQQWIQLRDQPALLKGIRVPASGTFEGTAVANMDVGNVYMTDELAKVFKRLRYTDSMIEKFFADGGKVVRYKIAISLIILSYKEESGLVLVHPGKSRVVAGLGYSMLTFCLGWWGFPWGLIYTPACLIDNFSGGTDMTDSFYVRILPATTPQASHVRQLGVN